jgi:thiol-disulfide isomerase/thioredoxin
MKRKRNLILLIVSTIAALFLLLLFARISTNKKIETAESGRKNLNFLKSIIDSTQNKHPFFNESLKGKVVVINVWATWCGPCRKEIPELNKLIIEYNKDNIIFVALDAEDSTEELKVMKEKKIQFDYTLLFNQRNLIKEIKKFILPHEQNAIPINIVMNPDGKIEKFYIGADPESLKEVKEYLASVTKIK